MGLAGSLLAEQDFVGSIQPTSDDELRDADRFSSCMHRSRRAFSFRTI